MRKVFVDDLPYTTNGFGANKNKKLINWKASIGLKVPFEYDNIKGFIKILYYNSENRNLKIIYEDNECVINCYDLIKGNIGKVLKKRTNEFKIKINTRLNDEKRDLLITDREYRNKTNQNFKWYKYTCNKCGWTEGWMEESNLLSKKYGCACCNNKITVLGINTIWDTDRWMCSLGISEEDAKRYLPQSNKKIKVVCPDCGKTKNICISKVYLNKSVSCTCGDGFSYPEKIMYSMLKQLNIDFTSQLTKTTFDWCRNYRYDFYIPSLNMIIELHGNQHYNGSIKFDKSLQEIQENDKSKEILAKNNGIKDYVIIDCRYSILEFIKNNIINSVLSNNFNLNQVNWELCDNFALKNIAKDICNYWNNLNEGKTVLDVCMRYNYSRTTIIRYLKKGKNLGWCNYDSKEERIKNGSRIGKSRRKQVEILRDNIVLGIFESATELERKSEELFGVRINNSYISKVCNGKITDYKGYTFRYVNKLN